MSLPSPTSFRSAALLLLVGILLVHCGCSFNFEQDPAKTVTVEITGLNNDADRETIQETLKGMTDGSSHQMISNWSGDKMTITLSPVSDVQAFSRKINFGKVTKVDGRTVKVEFVK